MRQHRGVEALDYREEVRGVPISRIIVFLTFRQLLEPEFTDRFEHGETSPAASLHAPDEVLFD
jgi:hypothetical protein